MIKSFWQKNWHHAAAIAIFLVIACIYCKPVLQGMVLDQNDTKGWKGMAQQSMEFKEKHGHLPLWTNSMFGGMPAYQIAIENNHSVTLYYFNTVFTLGLPKPINFFFLACVMFYFLCQVLRVNPWISIGSAIAYAYSTYDPIIISVGHDTKMTSMAYAPAVIASIMLLYNRQYWTGAACTVIFSSLMIAQSHQQIVYYLLMIAVAIAIAYAVKCFREKQMKHFVIANAIALAGALTGLASNATVNLTTYEYAKETIRGGKSELTLENDKNNKTEGGLDKEYAFRYSYGIGETFTFIVPALYGGSNSQREFTGPTKFTEKLSGGMPEESALQLANGYAYWGNQPGTSGPVYLGAIICFLFIVGLFFVKGWQKWWIIGITIFGIMLAWGKNFEAVNYFLFDHMPLYSKFRAPSIALFIPQLTFTLMAALALQQVLYNEKDKALAWKKVIRSLYVAAAVFIVLGIFYTTWDFRGNNDNSLKEYFSGMMLRQAQGQQPTPEMQQQAEQFSKSLVSALQQDRKALMGSDLLRSIFLVAITAGLLLWYVYKRIDVRFVLAAILLLSSYDLLSVGRRYLNYDNFVEPGDYESYFAPTAADNIIKADPDPDKYFRVFDQTGGDPFSDSRGAYHFNLIGGYHPAKLSLYQDIISYQIGKGNISVLNMLNTRWVIRQNPANGQPEAIKNEGAYGAAWLVKNIHYVKNADEEMKALDSIDVRDTVIVQEKYKSNIAGSPVADSTASIKLVENLNDKITYTFASHGNQFAVFSEVYYDKGWKAFIDGKEMPYVKVDYALRGMSVPAGNHSIEFRFEPASYRIGNTISLVAALIGYLLLIVSAWFSWKNRQRSPAAPRPAA
jgi:hypothetical protein